MLVAEVVARARAAVEGQDHDPAAHGLARLRGGMSHDVFTPLDEPGLVVKVFRSSRGDGAEREWSALVSLTGTGLAPEPVHHSAGGPAVVVMTRVAGAPLAGNVLGNQHARMIGAAHRLVHQARGASRQVPLHSGIHAARAALLAGERKIGSEEREPRVITSAWTAARAWVAGADMQGLLAAAQLRYCRGDPNLANYLWSADRLALVDWEHSGDNDPAFELADMAEHASTRSLPPGFWEELADATELTPTERRRIVHARRLMACFWLVLIESRCRSGLPTTVTLEEQARRTLATLGRG